MTNKFRIIIWIAILGIAFTAIPHEMFWSDGQISHEFLKTNSEKENEKLEKTEFKLISETTCDLIITENKSLKKPPFRITISSDFIEELTTPPPEFL